MVIPECWVYLLVAIPFGVLGTISLKLSDGLKKWKPCISLALFYVISFVAMTFAMQGMDVSVVYGIWSGVGTILIAIIGILVFEESMSIRRIIALCLIILGVFGIQFANALS